MDWLIAGGIALALVLVAGLLYWQLIIAEGAYLGRAAVIRLYDWSARRYDRIKQFHPQEEDWFLGWPLSRALQGIPCPLVLDVATGTGRLARTLLRQPSFHGHIVGLDLSRAMLAQAVEALADQSDRVTWLWQDATWLPFADASFDCVTCLEALEFLPRPKQSLAEMVRVLRPGGLLFVTNRIGWEARLLPGRTFSAARLQETLEALGLRDVRIHPWQICYQLAWGRRKGLISRGGSSSLSEVLRCPRCAGHLHLSPELWTCLTCGRRYPVEQGIVCLQKG